MQRGEVWWADLPAPIGRRPVLITTRSAVALSRCQLMVAEITRTLHHIASEVPLSTTDTVKVGSLSNGTAVNIAFDAKESRCQAERLTHRLHRHADRTERHQYAGRLR